MQIIHILGDQQEFPRKLMFKLGKTRMSWVRVDARRLQLFASSIVKLIYKVGVSLEPLWGCYIFDWVIGPEAIAGSEGIYA